MTAMMTVTCQMTLMKLRISLDAGVRCIFDSTEIPVYLENGTRYGTYLLTYLLQKTEDVLILNP